MDTIHRLISQPDVSAVLTTVAGLRERAVALAIEIQQIAAPTFHEARRAAFVQEAFAGIGLVDVGQDGIGNVYGRLPGRKRGRPVVVSAHLDTVFGPDTDLSVRQANGMVYGPGIGDNSVGVAGLLLLAQTLVSAKLPLSADLHFVANVGEEGLGDLRGMRAVVERFGAARYIILEGGVYGHLYHEGIGVRRFRIRVEAPGGHSWGAFGTPSAIHVLGRVIAGIDALEVPVQPRTTYNVGVIDGGTSVNSIAASASLLLDLRSQDAGSLSELVDRVLRLVEAEGQRAGVTVSIEQVGNRLPGRLAQDAALVRWAAQALAYSGCAEVEYEGGSTDANVPLSRGYEAVCVGVTRSGNAHRLDEFMDPTFIPQGLTQILLLALAAAAN